MDLEVILLSEISQRNTNTVWYHLQVESKIKQTREYNKKETDSDIEKKLVVTSGGREEGRGK